MAAIRISVGPRYQKTGSPSQKKARRIAEIMALVIDEALTQPKPKADRQTRENAPTLKEHS